MTAGCGAIKGECIADGSGVGVPLRGGRDDKVLVANSTEGGALTSDSVLPYLGDPSLVKDLWSGEVRSTL